MPKFGKGSLKALSTCDKKLQEVFNEVIKTVDCSILEGHRDKTAEATAARIMREEGKVLVGDADSQYRKAVEMCEGNCDCGC